MIRKAILFIVIFLAAGNLRAQDEFPGGSPYTVFGIGDIKFNTSLRTEGMGILGIGLPGNYINNLNPAANTRLNYTTFSLTGNYEFLKSSDGVKELKVADGNVNGINIGIPFNRNNGWVMNLGFNPYSSVSYKISRTGSTEGEAYTQTYSGDGGLSRISIGMTYITFKALSVGFEYNYAFGNIVNQSNINFTNTSITDTYIRKENDMRGSFFKGGLVFNMQNLTKNKNLRDFSLGFIYSSKIGITSTTDGIYGSVLGNDTTKLSESEIEIPQSFGVGLSNKFGGRFVVAADFLMQNWADYTETNAGIISSNNNFDNAMRYGLGFELQPSGKKDKTFLESLTYRLGGFYEKSYFKVNSEDITRMGLGLGFGIPITNFNTIDVAVSYSMRGKTGNGLIKDDLLNVSLGFNFGELWFIRPTEE